ncbi:MAG: hypothetical protein HYX79_01530 [Chloroflexi bacterium]|nr:hypothetical protein [Chloroflexota bacterium]
MDRGKAICRELKMAGIRYLAWLPDSETHFMHEAIHSDPALKLIQVCREGEALAICAGLHLGGSKSALLVENQGIFDSGNNLKWIIDLKIPLVMLVGYLLYHQMQRTPEGNFRWGRKDYTEPFLDCFDVKHYLVDSDSDAHKVGLACKEAHETRRPVAVLLTSADGFIPGT